MKAEEKVRLTFSQKLQMVDLIRGRLQHYLQSHTPVREIVREVCEKVGVGMVSEPTLRRMAMDAGLRLPRKRVYVAGQRYKTPKRVDVLERVVMTLCEKLGEPLPVEWQPPGRNGTHG